MKQFLFVTYLLLQMGASASAQTDSKTYLIEEKDTAFVVDPAAGTKTQVLKLPHGSGDILAYSRPSGCPTNSYLGAVGKTGSVEIVLNCADGRRFKVLEGKVGASAAKVLMQLPPPRGTDDPGPSFQQR